MDWWKHYIDITRFFKRPVRKILGISVPIFIVLLVLAANSYVFIDYIDREPINDKKVEDIIYDKIDEKRVAAGLQPLNRDEPLEEIAGSHSEDMAERNYYSHESPEGNDFTDRYREHGYACKIQISETMSSRGSEVIHKTYSRQEVETDRGERFYDSNRELATGIVNAWMNSSEHREIILKGIWSNHGAGVEITDIGTVYATLNFC